MDRILSHENVKIELIVSVTNAEKKQDTFQSCIRLNQFLPVARNGLNLCMAAEVRLEERRNGKRCLRTAEMKKWNRKQSEWRRKAPHCHMVQSIELNEAWGHPLHRGTDQSHHTWTNNLIWAFKRGICQQLVIWNRATAPEDKKNRTIYPTCAKIQHLAIGRQILQQKKKSVGNLISELLPQKKEKKRSLLCDIDFTVSV